MSALRQAVDDYLQLRRALGYRLERHGRLVPQFVEFLEQRQATVVTTELALAFATQPADASAVFGTIGWRSCAALPATCGRRIPAPRCHPSTCCRPSAAAPCPTSTRKRRSSG